MEKQYKIEIMNSIRDETCRKNTGHQDHLEVPLGMQSLKYIC